jgi:CRISPR/Cas system-associated endonuclease Cas1
MPTRTPATYLQAAPGSHLGEVGVRLYSSCQPGCARADRLLYQAKLALDDSSRLKVVSKMYAMRFVAPIQRPFLIL